MVGPYTHQASLRQSLAAMRPCRPPLLASFVRLVRPNLQDKTTKFCSAVPDSRRLPHTTSQAGKLTALHFVTYSRAGSRDESHTCTPAQVPVWCIRKNGTAPPPTDTAPPTTQTPRQQHLASGISSVASKLVPPARERAATGASRRAACGAVPGTTATTSTWCSVLRTSGAALPLAARLALPLALAAALALTRLRAKALHILLEHAGEPTAAALCPTLPLLLLRLARLLLARGGGCVHPENVVQDGDCHCATPGCVQQARTARQGGEGWVC